MRAGLTGARSLPPSWYERLLERGGGHRFVGRGAWTLKGIPDPVATCIIEWDPPDLTAKIPFPSRLGAAGGRLFCGRRAESEILEDAAQGVGCRVPTGRAHLGGGRNRQDIPRGRVRRWCSPRRCGGALRPLRRRSRGPVPTLDRGAPPGPSNHFGLASGRARGALRRGAPRALSPELATRIEGWPEPRRADVETERFLLFDAVVGMLGLVTLDAPVVLVLDDLHWADRPSLLLLRHLVRDDESCCVCSYSRRSGTPTLPRATRWPSSALSSTANLAWLGSSSTALTTSASPSWSTRDCGGRNRRRASARGCVASRDEGQPVLSDRAPAPPSGDWRAAIRCRRGRSRGSRVSRDCPRAFARSSVNVFSGLGPTRPESSRTPR